MLTGVVIVLLAMVLLLALPVAVEFDLKRRECLAGTISVRWFFGLVNTSHTLGSGQDEPATTKNRSGKRKSGNDKQGRKSRRAGKKRKNHLSAGSLLQNIRVRRRLFRFFADFWSAFHKRAVVLRLWFGLDDPADTGRLCGVVCPLIQLLRVPQDVILHIQPEFSHPGLVLEASGSIWLRPLKLVVLVLSLFLSPTLWTAIFKARR